jgi:hypothetical protein
MKKSVAVVITIMLALVMVVSAVSVAFADKQNPDGSYKGNGVPSGPHYNLNIIGMENTKNPDANMENGNGHRIFVKLNGNTKIMLTEGEYAVLDCDGTDGMAAFQLPDPVAGGNESHYYTAYSVFIRPLGGPHGTSANITTCAKDSLGETVCSTENVVLVRNSPAHGNNKFKNVSKELLFVYVDLGNGLKRYPLFGDKLEGFFWDYDNNGLKIAQLRFYEIETVVPKS